MQVRTGAGAVFAYQYRSPPPLTAPSQLSNKQSSSARMRKMAHCHEIMRGTIINIKMFLILLQISIVIIRH